MKAHDSGRNGPRPRTAVGERAFWSVAEDALFATLDARPHGLSSDEAAERLDRFGPNTLRPTARAGWLGILLRQFTSPIVLILLAAALLAFLLHDAIDGAIILGIVGISGLLGFWQERGATSAVERLLELVEHRVTALRDGEFRDMPADEVVPGDVLRLRAGSRVPADCRILDARDLFVNEAALTGEPFPVTKEPGRLPADAPPAQRTSALFMGTNVVSGMAVAVAVHTGPRTEFGMIAERLRQRAPETEFEHGLRRFGYFLGEVTLLLVLVIFFLNVILDRPVFDALLFSLALAVGLTPQLLPAIVSVNLASGAKRMAERHVIVKRLSAIENFGSMNVLCADKTGTLTTGNVQVHAMVDTAGEPSEAVRLYAWLNASMQSGYRNPIDTAITAEHVDAGGWVKRDEIPYDFARRRLSIVAENDNGPHLVLKGAVDNVLAACTKVMQADGSEVPLESRLDAVRARYNELSGQGYRTLGIAVRRLDRPIATAADETDMTLVGFAVLEDPPRAGIRETLEELRGLGIALRIVTGDNRLVALQVARRVGVEQPVLLTGDQVDLLDDEALSARATGTDIFAEIEPRQKERIVRALRGRGHVVGYMGDGINDAPALHAADVGISVKEAVDVARDAAHIVLLEPDLAVLADGVRAGRRTFANTLKYVFMATSANFGNMFSMAGASLFLPFLPLLPTQILLVNLMTDMPEMTIPTDRVDDYWIERPHRWDVGFIRRFMVTFGVISSVFDYLTFGVLLLLLHATPELFRSGWFVESVVSASLIVLVIRTRLPFYSHRPSRPLLVATVAVIMAATALPYSPLGPLFRLEPLPASFLGALAVIVVLYVTTAELAKRRFFRHSDNAGATAHAAAAAS